MYFNTDNCFRILTSPGQREGIREKKYVCEGSNLPTSARTSMTRRHRKIMTG